MPKTFPLPAQIYEAQLPRLLKGLARIGNMTGEIQLDMTPIVHWTPAAIVSFCAIFNKWRDQGKQIELINVPHCKAFSYLRRLDFFEHVGVHVSEDLRRRAQGEAFVEVQRVEANASQQQNEIASKLAACLAGTDDWFDDVYRLSQYALGEILTNLRQHSRSHGFAAAQYIPAKDWARTGVADAGLGIRESFRGSPYDAPEMTDAQALEKAMTLWVSSRKHLSSGMGVSANKGVGLKVVLQLVAASAGELFISSGNAWHYYRGSTTPTKGVLPDQLSTPGVCVSILFKRDLVSDYNDLIKEVWKTINLTADPDDDIFFT